MATSIPIDLSQITWTNGNVTRFEVLGNHGAKQLLQEEPTTCIVVVHHADLGHDIKEGKAAVFLYIEFSITSGNPAQPLASAGVSTWVLLLQSAISPNWYSIMRGLIP